MLFERLNTKNNFEAIVHLDESNPKRKDPKKIQVRNLNTGEVLIDLNTDAVDCMGFCKVDFKLESLDVKEIDAVINCFSDALNKYGGKNLFAVPKKLISVFEKYGFNTSPKLPNNQTPYKRLMYIRKDSFKENIEKLRNQFISTHKEEENPKSIRFITKDELITRANELSRLLIDNAEYASSEDKRKGYSEEAILSRLKNVNVFITAIEKDRKLIGFLRMYNAPGIGVYASDLVTAKEVRHIGFSLALAYRAFLTMENKSDMLFLIAGSDDEAVYYQNKFGCKAIFEEKEPVTLVDDKVFMFKLNPKSDLINNLLDSYEMPEGPKTMKSKQEPSASDIVKNSGVGFSSQPQGGKEEFEELDTTSTATTTSTPTNFN